jgi:hypothetical protein
VSTARGLTTAACSAVCPRGYVCSGGTSELSWTPCGGADRWVSRGCAVMASCARLKCGLAVLRHINQILSRRLVGIIVRVDRLVLDTRECERDAAVRRRDVCSWHVLRCRPSHQLHRGQVQSAQRSLDAV